MDEKITKAIEEMQIDHEALQRLIDYIKEGIEICVEQIKEFANFMSEILPDLLEILENVIGNIQTQRKRWRIEKQAKLRPLYLDKRSKIHRCRNAC